MRSLRPTPLSWLLLLGVALIGVPAQALINPNFTPIHLVTQSDQILELTFSGAKDGGATATVKNVLKGKETPKNITLNLKTSAYQEHTVDVAKSVNAQGDTPALFFSGRMQPGGAPGSDAPGGEAPAAASEEAGEKGLLHMGTRWISFDKGKDGVWELDRIDDKMLGTWNGDTPMLRNAVQYILSDPAADLPCAESVRWGTSAMVSKAPGRVSACLPFSLTDAGEPALLVASDAGDRLLQWDAKAKKMRDITGARKLATKSLAVAVGDWNNDGRSDLASWNGQTLTVNFQEADGAFRSGPALPKSALANGVVSLSALDAGTAGHPAVLIGTAATPLLWTVDTNKSETALTPISATPAPIKELGAAGRCLVADFDGDGLPDVLQVFVKGSLFYKGAAAGRFAAPAACAIALGSGPADAFVGDFDQDGLLDVFTAGDIVYLWNNRGNGRFLESLNASGELSYKGNVNACGGAMGDFNSDGLQDVIFFYPAEVPNMNFNRGFRSFGHANIIDFQINSGVLPGADAGQQTGCWADLDGDGVPELVVVLKDGAIWFMPFDNNGEKGRCIQAAMAGKGAHSGPVNVTAWRGKRGFGAWNVAAGAPAMISQTEAGPLTLKWSLPGGQPQSKTLVIENAPVKFTLP